VLQPVDISVNADECAIRVDTANLGLVEVRNIDDDESTHGLGESRSRMGLASHKATKEEN
jgi:hypothetical protein